MGRVACGARLVPDERRRRYAAFFRHMGHSAPAPGAVAAAVDAMEGAGNSPVALLRPVPGYVVTVVSYEAARRWAISEGLCTFRGVLNLRAVNAARVAAGLHPFVLRGAG